MTTAQKVIAAAVLLAAGGVIAWIALQDAASRERGAVAAEGAGVPPVVDPVTPTPRAKRGAGAATEEAAAGAAHEDLPPPVELDKCDRDLDLHGIVVDADGKGVAGARIATVTYPWRVAEVLNMRDRDLEIAGPSMRSARDGTFSMRLGRGPAGSLRVAADGYASVEIPNVLAGERVRVTLRPGVRLVVVLLDAAGAPAEGAGVRLFNNDRDGGKAINARGVSGADGVCVFDSLPPEAWAWIAAEHASGIGEWTKVDLPASGEKRQEIRLPTSRTITGSVVDAATRSAIAGARVGMNWVLNMAVETRADGTYALPGWTGKGIEDVQVLAEGYAREAKNVGTAERLDFELQRGYAVAGRVVGTESRPVAGALISVIASEMSGRDQRMSHGYATTDAEGRFRVTSLRVGMLHGLTVTAPEFARLRRETPVATSVEDIALGDVVLAAPRRVEGVVVATDGTPQPRVAVSLGPATREANSYGGSFNGFTDDLGRFRFTEVAPGKYSVTARSPRAPETKVDVTVAPDADLLDVKLVRAATREIVITVVDSDDEPVAGAILNLSVPPGNSVQGRTDAQGIGRVSVPPGGKVQLFVWTTPETPKKFVQFKSRDLREDEPNVRVVLEVGAEVTGRLVDPDGAPVAGAQLRFETSGDAKPFAQTGDDGKFQVTVPKNGRSTLVFEGNVRRNNRFEDLGLTARVEDIAPGADLVVRCERVPRDRKLTVVVVSPQDMPVEAATVFVSSNSGFRTSAQTDAKGGALLENLPAFELNVIVFFQGGEFLPPTPSKATPQGQELRLVCRTATKITGTVAGEDGVALPAGSVQALRDGKSVGFAQVDRDGRFTLLLPSEETAPVRLQLNRTGGNKPPDAVLDGVAPGTQDVRVVVKK